MLLILFNNRYIEIKIARIYIELYIHKVKIYLGLLVFKYKIAVVETEIQKGLLLFYNGKTETFLFQFV